MYSLKYIVAQALFYLISFSSLFFESDYLKLNQHYFFIAQVVVFLLFVVTNIKYVSSFFLPSFFILFYYLFSFSLGSYYVPREFGYITEYYSLSFSQIENYTQIVFYLLFSNSVLLSLVSINERKVRNYNFIFTEEQVNYRKLIVLLFLFLFFSAVNFFGRFGFQVMLAIVIVGIIKSQASLFRYAIYLIIVSTVVIFNHENKREIILIFMLLIFLESFYRGLKFKVRTSSLLLYFAFISIFIVLILTSSILRGYGGFGDINIIQALFYIPDYIASETFIDSLVDNFEISHTYPAAVLPVEYVISGKLPIIWGESIIKPLFLPLPREVFDFKPESALTIFTKIQDSAFYDLGGSLPVAFPAELFMNFFYLAPLFLASIIGFFDSIFLKINKYKSESLAFKASVAAILLVFIFVRGGGLDLYTMTWLSAVFVGLLTSINKNSILWIK